jgi:hypothetical protein
MVQKAPEKKIPSTVVNHAEVFAEGAPGGRVAPAKKGPSVGFTSNTGIF